MLLKITQSRSGVSRILGNGNDQWKMPDKGHHVNIQDRFTAQCFLCIIVLIEQSLVIKLIEQSRMFCLLSHQGPALKAWTTVRYIRTI